LYLVISTFGIRLIFLVPFFQIKNGMEPKRNGGREGGNYFYGAEWNGMERRQREGEGEETLRVTLM
jgi:hypothetical protein